MSLLELARHLDRQRFSVQLLAMAEGPLVEAFRKEGFEVLFGEFPFFSRRRPWLYWGALWRLVRLLRWRRIDMVHVNCDRAVPHMVAAGRLARVPVLCHIHDMNRAWFLPQYARYLNRSAQIIADSEATARHCLAAGMRSEKIEVVYECFEMDRFTSVDQRERQKVRKEFGLENDDVAIGLVGQILAYKGHETFVRAARRVTEQCSHARFFIVGDDRMSADKAFLPHLRELVVDLGLEDRMIFTGFRKDIPAVTAAMDVLAVPSWAEPFGRVVVEGLAAGRPVVGTNAGGIPEILTDGHAGYLVPPKNERLLADKMLMLCSDEELRRQMGERAPAIARRFDVHGHVQQFEQIYQELAVR